MKKTLNRFTKFKYKTRVIKKTHFKNQNITFSIKINFKNKTFPYDEA